MSKLVVDVENQERTLGYWRGAHGFELLQDASYGQGRWLEMSTPDQAVTLIPSLRQGERSQDPDMLPTSNVFFSCEHLDRTYQELRSRGVELPQAPVEQSFGWRSMFQDTEGNRFRPPPGNR